MDTEHTDGPGDDAVAADDPRVRRAWLVVGSVAVVALMAFGTVEVVGLLAREESTVREDVAAAGIDAVEVSSDDGDVRVIGDAETSIRVVIRLREGWRRVEREVRVDRGRLILSASCPSFSGPFCNADFEVHVPPGVTVVATSRNGDAVVSDVDGGATLTSENGHVEATRLGGSVRLTTDNGDVIGSDLTASATTAVSSNGDVSVSFERSPRTALAQSDNGDVEVIVPRGDEMYAVDATTDNGEARTPIRTDPDGSRRVVARSDNGDVTVRYP